MNSLNVASALAEIKISQLDDEFQMRIMGVLNEALPGDLEVVPNITGDELKRILQVEVPKTERSHISDLVVFEGDEVRRFYNDLEKCQRDTNKNLAYDDGVKGNFISNMAMMCILFVLASMSAYALTNDTRGGITESKTASVIGMVVSGLSKDVEVIEREIDGEE